MTNHNEIEALRKHVKRYPVEEKSQAIREKRLDHRYGHHTTYVRGCPDCQLKRLEEMGNHAD